LCLPKDEPTLDKRFSGRRLRLEATTTFVRISWRNICNISRSLWQNMSLRWNIRAHDAHLVESIERECKVSPVVAQLLALRGLHKREEIDRFLDLKMTGLRAPQELPGVVEAVDVIFDAIESGQKIWVYGDYDADGMTSTAILYRCLRKLGAEVSYFVPNRLDDGYGVNKEKLKMIADRGGQLVITVDCGITSVEEVEYAKSIGVRMVITDHHVPGQELPKAEAIVHPGLSHAPYPFPGLCGAGVAFKLAWAMCQRKAGSPKLPEPRSAPFAMSFRCWMRIESSCTMVSSACGPSPIRACGRC